jgi:hypothetical protein
MDIATIDFTPYYYTYSTVAQTLASVFAFLTAVFILRWPEILGKLEKTVSENGAPGKDQPEQDGATSVAEETDDAANGAHVIMGGMRIALTWTAVTIGACFVLMPSTSIVAEYLGLVVARACLVLTVASALLCLVLYSNMLLGMMGLRGYTISRLEKIAARAKVLDLDQP